MENSRVVFILGTVALGGAVALSLRSCGAQQTQATDQSSTGQFGETYAERAKRLGHESVNSPALDERIDGEAIRVSTSASSGVTAKDIPVLRAGARLVLATRPDCPRVTDSDAILEQPDHYYVTCGGPGVPSHNIFFSKQDIVEATDSDPAAIAAVSSGQQN